MLKKLTISKLSVQSCCLKILINSDADVRPGAKCINYRHTVYYCHKIYYSHTQKVDPLYRASEASKEKRNTQYSNVLCHHQGRSLVHLGIK